MTAVTGIAVGLAAARLSWAGWHEGVLAAVLCWFLIGLAPQILDLRAALRRTPGEDSWLRFAARLAIAWRVVAMALIIGYCVFETFRREGWIALPRQTFEIFDERRQLCDLTFYFAIVLILASAPQLAPRQSTGSVGRKLVAAVSWLLAAGLCLLVWTNWPFIVFLVHLAITGIENNFPLKFANPDIDLNLVARSQRFAVHSLPAVSLVPLNLWLVRRLARNWPGGRRRRYLDAVGILFGIAAAASYGVWLKAVGLPQFSPHLAANTASSMLSICLYAAPLLLVASGAASYRLITSSPDSLQAPMLRWRREPRRYYHERRLTMATAAVAIGGNLTKNLTEGGIDWQTGLQYLFDFPENYLQLAAFWLACCGVIRGWRKVDATAPGLIALSPWRFFTVWPAMFAALVTAIPLLAWFSFTFWILLGYRFEWL